MGIQNSCILSGSCTFFNDQNNSGKWSVGVGVNI